MSYLSRVCPSCKWEFPSSYPKTRCKFCSTRFTTQRCLECNTFVDTSDFYEYKTGKNVGQLQRVCKSCNAEIKRQHDIAHPEQKRASNARFNTDRLNRAQDMYEQWLQSTKLPFKPMTETEWLEACSYFGGCAVCGTEHIESRRYFVPFESGGKYTSYNIFPMCGKCSIKQRLTENPFIWLDPKYGTAGKALGMTEERRQLMLDYFILQIEKVGAVPCQKTKEM